MRRSPETEGEPTRRALAIVNSKNISVVGRAIYQKLLPRLADTAKKGQIVVIDINSGDYEIVGDDITATDLLTKRRPDAITWAGRVGYPAPYRMSARGFFPEICSKEK